MSGDDGVAQVEIGDAVRANGVPLRVGLEHGDRDDERPRESANPARQGHRRRYGLISDAAELRCRLLRLLVPVGALFETSAARVGNRELVP